MDEDYYFRIDDELSEDRVFVLIIYDIISNKSRNKFSKLLLGLINIFIAIFAVSFEGKE